jgi:preprotein translocase subunit Sec63
VAKDATDYDIRQAYRGLARKFHPDKNPEGREVFEKIQKAYVAVALSFTFSVFGGATRPFRKSIPAFAFPATWH